MSHSHASPRPLRRIAILFNPVSGVGRGAVLAQTVEKVLRADGCDVVCVPTRREPAMGWLPPVLADRDAVVVIGGDGAVRLASLAAAKAQVALYHYPAGTENLFGRAYGMQPRAETLRSALHSGVIDVIDIGLLEQEPFTLMASAGFDADVVHGLAAHRGRRISHLSYAPIIGRELLRWSAPSFSIAADGGAPCPVGRGFLVVANAPDYALRMNPVRHAHVSDGRLDAAFFRCTGGLGAAIWALRMLAGRAAPAHRRKAVQGPFGAVPHLRGERLAVLSETPVRWQLDGDPVGPAEGFTAVSITVLHRALRIVRPSNSTA